MFYYLDKKEILENHLPKMYYKSEKPLNKEEIEKLLKQCKENFGDITLIEYEADYLPSYLYIDEQGKVKEYIPISTFAEERLLDETETISKEDIFGEEDNNNYVYIDKEECLKNYSPCVCRVSKGKRLLNYKELYDGNVLEYIGKDMADLPNEVIYDSTTDLVRGMTEYEKVKYKKRELAENEVILEKKKEIVSISEGQYVNENEDIITIPKPEGAKMEWDKISHIWKEGATEEEKKTEWFNRINSWKPKVLEGPFRYIHSDGKTYNQKLRVGKDDTLLSTAIQALIRNTEIPSIEWAFDDDNNSVLMTLEDLRKLQDTGFVWTQAVYEAERELKAMSPDFTKDINFFKEVALNHVSKYRIK